MPEESGPPFHARVSEELSKLTICLACGYNLQGVYSKENPSGHCPECGQHFDGQEIRAALSELPPHLTLADHMVAAPVLVGAGLNIILSAMVILLSRTSFLGPVMAIGFFTAFVFIVWFSVWRGKTLNRIDRLNNWCRHAMGEKVNMRVFGEHRWIFFGLIDFVILSIALLIAGLCSLSMLMRI